METTAWRASCHRPSSTTTCCPLSMLRSSHRGPATDGRSGIDAGKRGPHTDHVAVLADLDPELHGLPRGVRAGLLGTVKNMAASRGSSLVLGPFRNTTGHTAW